MVFKLDNESKKIYATIHNGSRIEKYRCTLSACNNPVCTCRTVYLELIPLQVEDGKDVLQYPHRKVEIDIAERNIGYRKKNKVPEDVLEFAELFLGQLDENDFQFLHESHFAYKNKISEKAPIDSIDAHFEYEEIEYDGAMYAYNDVLPYGDQLQFSINEKNCVIFDQYCLLPKCSCSDTILNIFSADQDAEELCAVSLNYRKEQWKLLEKGPFPLTLNSVRTAIEEQLPTIYKQLFKRHIKLKSIYDSCKKRNYTPKQPVQLTKVGRNDPCPCGSGKKYKKCCLK